MANVAKYTDTTALKILRHNTREGNIQSNDGIDESKSHQNYSFIQHGDMTDIEYYQRRKQQLYCLKRKDVKTLASWILTAPKGLSQEQEKDFFYQSTRFLVGKYGIENAIQATVHVDEIGANHLHFTFICTSKNTNKHTEFSEKICAKEVLTRQHLQSFHFDLQDFLTKNLPFQTQILSGITREQGGNKTVKELKKSIEIERSNNEYERDYF